MGAGFTVNNPNAVSGCGCGSQLPHRRGRGRPGAAAPTDRTRRRRAPTTTDTSRRDARRLCSIPVDSDAPDRSRDRYTAATMQIPLFPLHTVLCPGIALPLHIFEERYRADGQSLPRHEQRRSGSCSSARAARSRRATAAAGAVDLRASARSPRSARRPLPGRPLGPADGRHAAGSWSRGHRTTASRISWARSSELDDALGDADTAEALVRRVSRRFVEYLRLLQPRDGEDASRSTSRSRSRSPTSTSPRTTASPRAGEADRDREPARRLTAPGRRRRGRRARARLRAPHPRRPVTPLVPADGHPAGRRRPASRRCWRRRRRRQRLRELDRVLDRELQLLRARLAPYRPDRRGLGPLAS